MSDLLACPRCGLEKATIETQEFWLGGDVTYRVYCGGCAISPGFKPTIPDALHSWNNVRGWRAGVGKEYLTPNTNFKGKKL